MPPKDWFMSQSKGACQNKLINNIVADVLAARKYTNSLQHSGGKYFAEGKKNWNRPELWAFFSCEMGKKNMTYEIDRTLLL